MEWKMLLALVLGTPVIIIPVAFIWYINIGGIFEVIRRRRVARTLEKALPDITCSLDTDCPEGYVCVEGYCVPLKA